jgi:hypothetical protein
LGSVGDVKERFYEISTWAENKKLTTRKKMKLMHSHSKDELRERREERKRVYGCSESV